MIQTEPESVQKQIDRESRLPGTPSDNSARLANLAAARLMALGGAETDCE